MCVPLPHAFPLPASARACQSYRLYAFCQILDALCDCKLIPHFCDENSDSGWSPVCVGSTAPHLGIFCACCHFVGFLVYGILVDCLSL